jgi:hemerythrin
MAELRARLREWLVQHTVRSDPEVRNAVGEVMKRRRAGVPAGAKGTK